MSNFETFATVSASFRDAYGCWIQLLKNLVERGQLVSPRGKVTRELLGATFRLDDMRNNIISHPGRQLNYRFMIAEWLWIALGQNDVETLAKYNKRMREFSDDGITLAGAYGPRIRRQLAHVTSTLSADPNSRQAVLTIWDQSPKPSKDIPCTISMQFIIREDKLHMLVTMRSSDIWLGLPYDIFSFSQIGNSIAGELKVLPGSLMMTLGSSHLYEEHFDLAETVCLEQYQGETFVSPLLPGWPFTSVFRSFTSGTPLVAPWEIYRQALRKTTSLEALSALTEWAS